MSWENFVINGNLSARGMKNTWRLTDALATSVVRAPTMASTWITTL